MSITIAPQPPMVGLAISDPIIPGTCGKCGHTSRLRYTGKFEVLNGELTFVWRHPGGEFPCPNCEASNGAD